MKSISKREKKMLLILGIFLLGYLYYSLFYSIIYKKIETSKSNINKYIQEIYDVKLNKELFTKQTSQLEKIKSKYEEAKQILPQIEMNPEIIANIQKYFMESGVQVKSIILGEPEKMQSQNNQNNNPDANDNKNIDKFLAVSATILFSANSYEEVMKFISLFENDKRFVQITNIVITANRSEVFSSEENIGISTEKTQIDDNEVEVIVVGEGEQYKEIPVSGQAKKINNVNATKQQAAQIIHTEYQSINFGEPRTKIEVSLMARYYYSDAAVNANE